MSAAKLYTPEVLALAVDLARWPAQGDLPLHGDARSATCGSTLAMDVALNEEGDMHSIGMRVHACAIGQASAAIFANAALGRSPESLRLMRSQVESWLEEGGALPDWPGIATIAPARDYPARHGAILLPWRAAEAALSTVAADR